MHKRKRKLFPLILLALALVVAGTGTVYAYLTATSEKESNTLVVAPTVDPTISNAMCVDVGTPGYEVYVRAVIVATWEKDGDVFAKQPSPDTDYVLQLNVGDGKDWFLGTDGFYYYRYPVQSGAQTDPLVLTYQMCDDADVPDGYQLHLQILSQTIQAEGTTDASLGLQGTPAVTDAWGVSVDPITKELTQS